MLTLSLAQIEDRLDSVLIRDGFTSCWLVDSSKKYAQSKRLRESLGQTRRYEAVRTAVWRLANGPLPPKSRLRTTCGNKKCVSPTHAVVEDRVENMRGITRKFHGGLRERTHCKNGHEFNADNLLLASADRHRRCAECGRVASKNSRARNIDALREKRFSLAPGSIAAMRAKTGEVCAICRATESSDGRALAIDHDHKTGRFRGFLCGNCNMGLGSFRDSEPFLLAAIAYLKENEGS